MDGPINGSDITGISPVDGHELSVVKASDTNDIKGIVERARAAQPAWQKLGFEGRQKLLKEACRRLLERRDQTGKLIHDEAGKLTAFGQMNEAIGPLEYVSAWIKVARPALKKKKLPINPIAMPGKSAHTELIARGVIGIIAPWNYPLGVYFKPALPALLCGNAVVLKPSEYAPRTGALFAEVLSEVLPKDVVQVVQGGRDVGAALIDSGIDALSFTGSPVGGRAVLKACAERMIPCSVELGGKDPAIILDDCDFDRTVLGILNWGFYNSGQDCGAVERVYVVEGIADRFVKALSHAAKKLTVPSTIEQLDNASISPLANAMQLAVVEDHVTDAKAKGADVLVGGNKTGLGCFFEPTVLDKCTHDMKVIADETFGPVIAIVRVKDIDEAIEKANDSRYGLNASVWTKDLDRAQQIARRLQCGTVFINNHALTGAMPFAPWTGVKDTGYGVANSEHALHTFTRPRTILVDKGSDPDPWWLPADALLKDMAERLAKAQLGEVTAALKVPSIMSARKKMLRALLK